MAVPPDKLMDMIKSQRGAAPTGTPPTLDAITAPSDASTPPMSAPMSTPEPKMGNKEAAMVNISMAMDLLEQSLPALGSDSAEGKQVLSAIKQMTGIVGAKKAKTDALQPTEILQMLQTLPQAGGATPGGKAMSEAPAIPGMTPGPSAPPPPPPMGGAGGMPMPGGAPSPQPM